MRRVIPKRRPGPRRYRNKVVGGDSAGCGISAMLRRASRHKEVSDRSHPLCAAGVGGFGTRGAGSVDSTTFGWHGRETAARSSERLYPTGYCAEGGHGCRSPLVKPGDVIEPVHFARAFFTWVGALAARASGLRRPSFSRSASVSDAQFP